MYVGIVQQHINGIKHQSLIKKRDDKMNKKNLCFLSSLSDAAPTVLSPAQQFNMDLCGALISANIRLHKVENPDIKGFLKKYSEHIVPDQSTLRKSYVRFKNY